MSTRIAKASVAMRKAPRQARSRATVEAVIEAGARILSDEGWAGFTTNKVAEAAGVSIGSLYQYFPDKDALVDAVRRRHLEDSLAAVRGAFAPGKPLARFAEDLADAVIAAHRTHPGLHRVLLDQVPVPDNYMTRTTGSKPTISDASRKRPPPIAAGGTGRRTRLSASSSRMRSTASCTMPRGAAGSATARSGPS